METFNDEKLIVWFSGNGYNEVCYAEDYNFESTISDEDLEYFKEKGKIYSQDEYGTLLTFKSVEEYKAYWDDFEASRRGNRLHIFTCEDAISYIANDMMNSDSVTGIADMYSKVLKMVAPLLEDI